MNLHFFTIKQLCNFRNPQSPYHSIWSWFAFNTQKQTQNTLGDEPLDCNVSGKEKILTGEN